ncbi:MAG: AraC family transcriptional regulator [Rikenellaceae bacterium]
MQEREKTAERIISKIRTTESVGFESHVNSRFHLGYILSGEKHFVTSEKRVICRKGDLFFMPIGNHHIENIVSSDSGYFEQIALAFCSEQLSKVIIPLNISLTRNKECRDHIYTPTPTVHRAEAITRGVFEAIDYYYNLGGFNDNPQSEMINLANLLNTVLEHEPEQVRCCIVNSIDQEQAEFEKVIFDNIFADKRIEQLAHEAHRSLTSFKKEFKRLFGDSPHRWYLQQRMNCAKMMLATTDDSISHISTLCTFNNTSHFIKLYKCYFGMTPAQHRRSLQSVVIG